MRALLIALLTLAAPMAQAVTINELTAGEFSDDFSTPTDWTGATTITGSSNGAEDFEYFVINALPTGTTQIDFTLENNNVGGGNALIRLSSTPFTLAHYDWTITELDAANNGARELYGNFWAPSETYTFTVPTGFTGPLYGFFRYYNTSGTAQMTINLNGIAVSAVPLPPGFAVLLAALGALGLTRRARPA